MVEWAMDGPKTWRNGCLSRKKGSGLGMASGSGFVISCAFRFSGCERHKPKRAGAIVVIPENQIAEIEWPGLSTNVRADRSRDVADGQGPKVDRRKGQSCHGLQVFSLP